MPHRTRLLDQIRQCVHDRGYSPRTGRAYAGWVRRFVLFHDKRHPSELGAAEVSLFLEHLTSELEVSPITRNQALSALRFLYRHVLDGEHEWVETLTSAKRPTHLPEVLSRDQIGQLLPEFRGARWLQVCLLYGSGLRLMECLRLRVKDVDLSRPALMVRRGKGGKDRQTVLPSALVGPLRVHLEQVKAQHVLDLEHHSGWVQLPGAYARKSPGAGRTWPWQWVFPASRKYTCSDTGQRRRHHAHESALQRAMKRAVLRSGLPVKASCHTLRHSFATHMIEDGCDLPTLQKLMGHADIQTTMQYVHLANSGPLAMGSPLDRIAPGVVQYIPDEPG